MKMRAVVVVLVALMTVAATGCDLYRVVARHSNGQPSELTVYRGWHGDHGYPDPSGTRYWHQHVKRICKADGTCWDAADSAAPWHHYLDCPDDPGAPFRPRECADPFGAQLTLG